MRIDLVLGSVGRESGIVREGFGECFGALVVREASVRCVGCVRSVRWEGERKGNNWREARLSWVWFGREHWSRI
jgi:hypothetical protein